MANPRKFLQYFFRNFNFRVMSQTDFWKIYSCESHEHLFSLNANCMDQFSRNWSGSCFGNLPCDTDGFLENSSSIFSKFKSPGVWAGPISGKFVHIWISFPEISLCHARNSSNINFQLNALFWMSFPEVGLSGVRFSSYCVVESLNFSFLLNLSLFLFVI